MTTATKSAPKNRQVQVKDFYADYRTAQLRSVHFWAKGDTIQDNEQASAFSDEGDRQNDLLADAHNGIVSTKVRDLHDLHCKLLTLKDGFSRLFRKDDPEMHLQRLMLEDAIEWVLAMSLHGDEGLPAEPVKLAKKKAA